MIDKNELFIKLSQELVSLEKLIYKANEVIEKSPPGILKGVMCHKKHPQYYWIEDSIKDKHPGGQYITTKDREFAAALAFKEYNQRILKRAIRQQKCITTFIQNYDIDGLFNVLNELTEAKRSLVTPYFLSDEAFLKQWYTEHPGYQNPMEFDCNHISANNKHFRSKTEMLIAERLDYYKIPYAYEAKFICADQSVIYPDFTVLNLRTRKTYYHEHLGKMGQEDYCRKSLIKIDKYVSSGILPGDSLITTMECGEKPLNFNTLTSLIEKYYM